MTRQTLDDGTWRRLRAVEKLESPPRWRRSVRRVRARHPLRDPVGQGLISLSVGSVAMAGYLLTSSAHPRLAALLIALAASFFAIYAALAARAVKRGKTVQYWQERRRLRADLQRETAFRDLVRTATDHLDRCEQERLFGKAVDDALQRMVEQTYEIFGPTHDDLAVLMVRQLRDLCHVQHSALSQGSRWHELRSGKSCRLAQDFETRLSELADLHTEPVELVDGTSGKLWFVVLHVVPLSPSESSVMEEVVGLFKLVANRWSQPHVAADDDEGGRPDLRVAI